jgi:Cu(I)/Ag(I) efflux system membrane fusion protein
MIRSLLLVLLLAAIVLGVHAALRPAAGPPADAGHAGLADFTCAMHPGVRSGSPGRCPECGMDLVPRPAAAGGEVTIAEGRRQLLGVRITTLRRAPATRTIRASGTVVYDEGRRSTIAPRFAGWIGAVYDCVPGRLVHAGDPLFSLMSPELIAAQTDYLNVLAAQARAGGEDGGRDGLVALARAKLVRLGMPADQLEEFERRRVPLEQIVIRAPADATVIERSVLPGARIEAGAPAVQLADLTSVWIEASVFAEDLPSLAAGQELALELQGGGRCVAPIAAILPEIDPATRTGRIRAAVANPDGRLKPGMLVGCAVQVTRDSLLTVPDEAVIYAGEKRVVFMALGGGRYRPVRVVLGVHGDGWSEVRDGVREGDTVVSSGVFLLASESRLAAGLDQW